MISLYKSLCISPQIKENISFIGAGGKTTSMFKLAEELKQLNKRVLVTTTTAIYYPDNNNIDNIVVGEMNFEQFGLSKKSGCITIWGSRVTEEQKLKGVRKESIDRIFDSGEFDFVLNEADGAKRKPLKAPSDYEPVVPDSTTKVVGIIGVDSLYKPVKDNVHRPEIFCELTGLKENDKVNLESICEVILHNRGIFKNIPPGVEKIVLLNKADDFESQIQGELLQGIIYRESNRRNILFKKVLVSSLLNNFILGE